MTGRLQIKVVKLPHSAAIPGGRGWKKISIPAGTTIYAIRDRDTGHWFWCGYLSMASAIQSARNFVAATRPQARHHIPWDTLVAFNFKPFIPYRINRERLSL